MLLGILSDTHDHKKRTRAAVDMFRAAGAEAIFHCGDLIGPEIVELIAVLPCYFVLGNNDCDSVPDLHRAAEQTGATCLDWAGEVTLAGKRIALAHGHMHTDIRRLLATEPDYLLSGHSHVPSDRRAGRTRRINPGALHRAPEYTIALLDPITDRVEFLQVTKWK